LANSGAIGNFVVVSNLQTGGRGSKGRLWKSISGNLHASILLDSSVDCKKHPQLSFVIANAVFEALTKLAQEKKINLNINHLKLKSYNLTGKIPYTISSLVSLSNLEIASNSIDGSIDYFSSIPRLVLLDISNNKFSGTLPDLLILSNTLVSFTASKNKLSGFGNLINQKVYNPPMVLQILDISYNKFLVTVPPNLFKSPSIQVMYIHYNNFYGTLPSMTAMATNLLKLGSCIFHYSHVISINKKFNL
jgi:hypothetical protein